MIHQGQKTQGAVNESGQESAEQEVRSADLAGVSVLKSSDASVPLKSPENQVQGEPLDELGVALNNSSHLLTSGICINLHMPQPDSVHSINIVYLGGFITLLEITGKKERVCKSMARSTQNSTVPLNDGDGKWTLARRKESSLLPPSSQNGKDAKQGSETPRLPAANGVADNHDLDAEMKDASNHADLPGVSLCEKSRGSEIYQETLAKALAKYFDCQATDS
ncbi:hypothetical protein HAX54_005825 [Datura stramonium]|uniref:Uncharacterized protein n=1 Tax=Datura stramonium TaxID=4076 RepID=A0ABS8TA66_DATST|nr:hypothetical protein [Datura stramonium]